MKARQNQDAKASGIEDTTTLTSPAGQATAIDVDSTAKTPQVDAGEARSPGAWPRWLDWRVVASVVSFKVLLFLFAAQAMPLLTDRRSETYYEWLQIWNQWDAPHYLDLAREGYVSVGEHRLWLVFYPLYPWLVRLASFFTGDDYLLGAIVVSAIASIAAALLLHRLTLLDEGDDATARGAVWFMLIFPTSYFLHIGYTESLFLALALGCFLAARGGRWWLAALLGASAGLTRVNGLVLLPVLAVEAFEQYRATRRFDRRWLWIPLVALGFGGYLLLNKYVAGDPFAFQKIMTAHWYKSLTWPWAGIRETMGNIYSRGASESQMVGVQELFFVTLGLAGTIWCCKELRASYGVWMIGNWLLWTSSTFIMSAPRYTLVMFPLYILFARLAARRPVWGQVVTIWSLLCLALFVTQFVQGRWAF